MCLCILTNLSVEGGIYATVQTYSMRAYWGKLDPIKDIQLIKNAYDNLVSNPPPIVAMDTETVSLTDTRVIGIGFGTPEGHNFFFSIDEATLPWHLVTDVVPTTTKLWANAPFDLEWNTLGKFGADIVNIEDVEVMLRLLDMPVPLHIAHDYVNAKTWVIRELMAEYDAKTMLDVPLVKIAEKCCRDVAVTMQLYQLCIGQVDYAYYKKECRVISMLIKHSHHGLALDIPYVDAMEAEIGSKEDLFVESLKAQGFNPLSHQQVGIMLTHKGIRLPITRRVSKTTGAISYAPRTDKEVLEGISHPWAAATLLARKYNKLHGTIRNMKGYDRVHSIFALDSQTARITSKKADRKGYLQQHNLPTGRRLGDIIPEVGPVRRAFTPENDKPELVQQWLKLKERKAWAEWDRLARGNPENVFTRFDMSQVELRILAYMSQDPVMLAELNSPGGDIHGRTQRELGIHSRVMAKNFNFGTIYGGGVEILSIFTGIKDYNLLRYYQGKLFGLYPTMARWTNEQRARGIVEGSVETLGGRKLSLLNQHSTKQLTENHIGNCAVNYPIQGTAAELFKDLLLALLDLGYVRIDDMLLQVHDEELLDKLYELPDMEYNPEEGNYIITGELAHLAPFYTPLELNYAPRWQ